MDAAEKKIETQVQFWSLLGPILILLSIAVLLFKVSVHWYFPISALIGIPLCVRWKMKGLALALGCLFLLSAIGYFRLDLEDRYWHVGLSITMAFSFIVLTLSLEEAEGLITKLQLESKSRFDNFTLLDEKFKNHEQFWVTEKEKYQIDIHALNQEVAKTLDEKQTFYKIAQLSKEEIIQVKTQHDLLMQDLFYKKEQVFQLQERVEEMEGTIQGFVNSDAEKEINFLSDSLSKVEQEKETLKARISHAILEGQAKQKENEQLWQEIEKMQKDASRPTAVVEHMQQEIAVLETKLANAEEQKMALTAIKDQLEGKLHDQQAPVMQHVMTLEQRKKVTIEDLKNQATYAIKHAQAQLILSKKMLESKQQQGDIFHSSSNNSRQIECMYQQLKEQFQEKCHVLDSTRHELFHTSEKLLKWQREHEEERLYGQSPNETYLEKCFLELGQQYDQMQKYYLHEIDEMEKLVEYLFKQIPT